MARSFRDDVYLPMLAKVSSYLRAEFHRVNHQNGSGVGFWSTQSRISRFNRQLDHALGRILKSESASAFSKLIAKGTATTWNVWSHGYCIAVSSDHPCESFYRLHTLTKSINRPYLTVPNVEKTVNKGMTDLDALFFWNLADSRSRTAGHAAVMSASMATLTPAPRSRALRPVQCC